MTADQSGETVIRRYLEAAQAGGFSTLGQFATDDLVMEWPQSGERFSGRDNAVAAMSAQPTKPQVAGQPRIVGSGDLWVVMMPLSYGTDVYHFVGVYELRDGRVSRATEYFGVPFPAQDYRAEWADQA